jgi:hypothetical protein
VFFDVTFKIINILKLNNNFKFNSNFKSHIIVREDIKKNTKAVFSNGVDQIGPKYPKNFF